MFVVFSCCVRLCMHAQGGALGRYVQRKLSGLKIFEEPFVSVRENLRTGIAICEQWVVACEHLTGQVWKSSKWGGKYVQNDSANQNFNHVCHN